MSTEPDKRPQRGKSPKFYLEPVIVIVIVVDFLVVVFIVGVPL